MLHKTITAKELLFSGNVDSWEDAENELERILEIGILENGVWSIFMKRQQVGRVKNLRLIIYPNDHPPPHLHVISPGYEIDAKFKISDGSLMKSGIISSSCEKKIQAWIIERSVQLQHVWDTTRPT